MASNRVDVAIIGGGVAGLSLAAQLAPGLSVTLLEAEASLGYHASGRSAALYSKSYGPPDIRALSVQSEPFFYASHTMIDGQALLSPRGELLIAAPEKEAQIRALADELSAQPGVRVIAPTQAEALHPLLDASKLGPCLFDQDARDIDVDLLLTLYRKMALAKAVSIRTGFRVDALEPRDRQWLVHSRSAGDSFLARVVVNAAGAWADQVAMMAGVKPVGLVARRRSMGVVPLPDVPGLDQAPMAIEIDEGFYIKAETGRLLISPADQTPVEPHDAYADDFQLAEACWQAEQLTRLEVKRMQSSWGGLRTFAPHGNPVIGFDPHTVGLFWSAGQGGYGIQTSPAWGAKAANLIAQYLAQ